MRSASTQGQTPSGLAQRKEGSFYNETIYRYLISALSWQRATLSHPVSGGVVSARDVVTHEACPGDMDAQNSCTKKKAAPEGAATSDRTVCRSRNPRDVLLSSKVDFRVE